MAKNGRSCKCNPKQLGLSMAARRLGLHGCLNDIGIKSLRKSAQNGACLYVRSWLAPFVRQFLRFFTAEDAESAEEELRIRSLFVAWFECL